MGVTKLNIVVDDFKQCGKHNIDDFLRVTPLWLFIDILARIHDLSD